jgi:hypothetical protein
LQKSIKMELNYKEDVKIDPTSLELEWLDQAELAVKYGKAWSELRKKVALLDEEIKVVRSRLIRKAWENPQECLGQSKGSIQTVEAYYRTHKKHMKLKQQFIEAQEELDLVEVAKNEIAFTRKSALENLVKLYASDYFAGPNVPRNLDEVRRTRDQQRADAVKSQVKVKRKDKR